MPEVVPTRIVSFTSEDKAFPASNLLKGSSFSKWRCISGGSKQEAVEFSFSEPVEISRIDIGNNGSAFIEVLVRRSASSDDPSVLLPSSSFMSPVDAKNETNLSRVRVFSGDQFIKSVSCQKWDLIKFVCSQPFNKTLQYGISFVFFHTPAIANPAADNKIIKLDSLMDEYESNSSHFKPGSLFQASRQTSCDQGNPESKSTISDKLSAMKHSTNLIQNINTPSSLCASKPSDHHKALKANSSSHQSNSRPSSSNMDTTRLPQSCSSKNNKSTASHSPSQKPLSNVILTLSGYQNPVRSQIRDKALELGAKYRQDWGPDCTHLICAFPNTPKFNLVKGKGIIVSDKWITQCYETKSNVPWRSYRVGRAPSPPNATTQPSSSNQSTDDAASDDDSQSPESKSSSHEPSLNLRGKKKSNDADWQPVSSDENEADDDDEFESTAEEEEEEEADNDDEGDKDLSEESTISKRKRGMKTVRKNPQKRLRSTANDSYKTKRPVKANNPEEENTDDEIQRAMISNHQLSNTEGEDYEETIKESLMNSLPDIFLNKHFFIHTKSIPSDEERLIKRLIIAFAGTLHQYMNNEVQYVLTRSCWDAEFDSALSTNSNMIFIRPEWIFACDQSGQWEAYGPYQVTPSS
ncbi:DNA repair protein isoform 2 [Schistosoma japonicum]|uniref:DNA repair protein isoform 2 n=1 Tax=Schistosoma japonicum TaxID=6182 RepID=A0A4Z2CS88_SCHJA|nr:DNA repair protein isoform 2 [Schistosoma japonicum]